MCVTLILVPVAPAAPARVGPLVPALLLVLILALTLALTLRAVLKPRLDISNQTFLKEIESFDGDTDTLIARVTDFPPP